MFGPLLFYFCVAGSTAFLFLKRSHSENNQVRFHCCLFPARLTLRGPNHRHRDWFLWSGPFDCPWPPVAFETPWLLWSCWLPVASCCLPLLLHPVGSSGPAHCLPVESSCLLLLLSPVGSFRPAPLIVRCLPLILPPVGSSGPASLTGPCLPLPSVASCCFCIPLVPLIRPRYLPAAYRCVLLPPLVPGHFRSMLIRLVEYVLFTLDRAHWAVSIKLTFAEPAPFTQNTLGRNVPARCQICSFEKSQFPT